jgi:hypothetical protein
VRLRGRARRLVRAARRGIRRSVASVERGLRRPDRGFDDDAAYSNVLFLGSTARSGTSITQIVLGRHSAYARIPIETKFLTAPGGLCDLVQERTTFRDFETRIRGFWFDREPGRGLQLIMDKATLDAALPDLREGLRSDPLVAARRFTHRLLDPIAVDAGRPGWIEKFPANVRKADVLYRIFPNMRLVHLVRDGRDVAASVVRFSWGPNDHDEALDWWARRLERGFAACDRVPPDRIHVIQIEDLIERDRDREYQRLLAFLGLDDEPAMREHFTERVTPSRMHTGRWRHEVPPERLVAFDAHHARLAEQLRARGRPYAPATAPSEPEAAPRAGVLV